MKKILGYSLLTAACVLLSGCATAHAKDNKPRHGYVNEDIDVKSGYYTCEENDSYIHVDGNMIECCNFDYTAYAENAWNDATLGMDAEMIKEKMADYDIFVKTTIDEAKALDALQEFVVYTYPLSTYYLEKDDITKLVLDFESAKESNSYGGYDYYADGSIMSGGICYRYAGEERPD